jgi:serine/threonine protein kinase
VSQQRFQLLERLFHEALELPASERAAFVRTRAGNDTSLCRDLEALLDSEGRAETHIEDVIGGVAASLPPAAGSQGDADVGLRLGPYTLVREIGRGGMGVVYQAVRTDGEYIQSVAIKLVRPGLHTDAVLQRFRAERQILATLQHPNIAALLDGGTAPDGRPYFVMEFIEGGRPLLEYCRQNNLPEAERLELFRVVCAAVDHAHRKGVIHRDI